MPVPLALAAPAALAGLAYVNAKGSLFYDWQSLAKVLYGAFKVDRREKSGRLNAFYDLEDHAKGASATKPCIIFEGKSWTYKETYDLALKYGTWLKTRYGVKSQEVVAMDFMNSEKYLFLWFGLWSIGAKPAFINYNLTGKALAHCISISKSRILLIDPQLQQNITSEFTQELPDLQIEVITPELEQEIANTTAIRVDDADRHETLAQNLAVLIYTSGTTGLPKGAIVSWRKMLISAYLFPAWMGFTQKDIFYTAMPFYHSSASMLGALPTITIGATISIGQKFSTKTFWQDVRASKATVIQYVGETCRYLLSAPPQIDPKTGENFDRKNNVRIAVGNGLRPDVWNRFKERFGIKSIAEFYGSTEGAGLLLNFSRNDFSKGAIGRSGYISRLLMGKASILVELDLETELPRRDPATGLCRLVANGTPGESLFKLDENDIGRGFQGYYGNKKSTDDKVLRDVLVKGDAYFRTGDVLSRDNEGRTYFHDRIGDTFRWKGENVSTNEVSEALGHHPKVQEANVYGIQLPRHDGRAGCAAIVLSEPPSQQLLSELAEHAKQRLPRFAVPLFLRMPKQMQITGTNKQQKHIVRAEGADPSKTGGDAVYWLKNGSYVKFGKQEWQELSSGRLKL